MGWTRRPRKRLFEMLDLSLGPGQPCRSATLEIAMTSRLLLTFGCLLGFCVNVTLDADVTGIELLSEPERIAIRELDTEPIPPPLQGRTIGGSSVERVSHLLRLDPRHLASTEKRFFLALRNATNVDARLNVAVFISQEGKREGQSVLAGVHKPPRKNQLACLSFAPTCLPSKSACHPVRQKPKCRRLRKSLLCSRNRYRRRRQKRGSRGEQTKLESYAVINSRARRRRYTRRCPCGVPIASTTDGLPATQENSLPKSATHSHQLELAIPKRSRIGGTQAGVEPCLPSTDCRAVQSSRSR